MTTIDPIELLERAAKSGSDIWESCVSAGIEAKGMLEEGRWTIGDLAVLVGKRYTANLIGEFANAINYEVASVREYRRVSRFWWEKSRRLELLERQQLHYSHFQDAMRLKDPQKAAAFLHECADKEWTVERARVELSKKLGKPVPPPKLLDGLEVCIMSIHKSRIELDVLGMDLEAKEALVNAWAQGKPVRVQIHALPDDGETGEKR